MMPRTLIGPFENRTRRDPGFAPWAFVPGFRFSGELRVPEHLAVRAHGVQLLRTYVCRWSVAGAAVSIALRAFARPFEGWT